MVCGLALGRHHLHPAPREDERRARGDGGGDDVGDPAREARRDERAGGEREQLAVARGDGGAEEADPEREVLNDGAGSGDADAEQPAHGDLEERERDHRQHRQRGDAVFDGRESCQSDLTIEDLQRRRESGLCRGLSEILSISNRRVIASA